MNNIRSTIFSCLLAGVPLLFTSMILGANADLVYEKNKAIFNELASNSSTIYPIVMTYTSAYFVMILSNLHLYMAPTDHLTIKDSEIAILVDPSFLTDMIGQNAEFDQDICSGRSRCLTTNKGLIMVKQNLISVKDEKYFIGVYEPELGSCIKMYKFIDFAPTDICVKKSSDILLMVYMPMLGDAFFSFAIFYFAGPDKVEYLEFLADPSNDMSMDIPDGGSIMLNNNGTNIQKNWLFFKFNSNHVLVSYFFPDQKYNSLYYIKLSQIKNDSRVKSDDYGVDSIYRKVNGKERRYFRINSLTATSDPSMVSYSQVFQLKIGEPDLIPIERDLDKPFAGGSSQSGFLTNRIFIAALCILGILSSGILCMISFKQNNSVLKQKEEPSPIIIINAPGDNVPHVDDAPKRTLSTSMTQKNLKFDSGFGKATSEYPLQSVATDKKIIDDEPRSSFVNTVNVCNHDSTIQKTN